MRHLLFARQAAIAACLIGMILPAIALSQTVLKVSASGQTSQTADSDWATVRDDAPAATDEVTFLQPIPKEAAAGSNDPTAAPASVPTPAAAKPVPVPAVLQAKVDVEPEAMPAIPSPPASPVAPEKAVAQLPPLPVPSLVAPADAGPMVGPFEILDKVEPLKVIMRRSTLLRAKVDITRSAVVDPTICDVVQFSPHEVSIIGKSTGATNVTFWFQDPSILPRTFLVTVTPDVEATKRNVESFALLEKEVNKLYPNSKVKLTPLGNKLLVTGQARDAAEAAQIMVLIRGEATDQSGHWLGGHLVEGTSAGLLTPEETGRANISSQVINLLRIPGVHQVVLRVKIAELNRTAARNFGVGLDLTFPVNSGSLVLQSLLTASTGQSVVGTFDHNNLNFGIHYLEEHGVVRMLSEPTLVTLSGQPASFVAGGEFAVPTVVGVQGASGISTSFRAFGAIISFLPVVLDKDRIRLYVSPEFSKINSSLSSGGIPGLDTRAVTTTVEMRKGQTLAIAGLLDDSMTNSTSGDVPFLQQIFGARSTSKQETELIILVTPELVQPMDPEEVPPLPGFDVTEPNNTDFYLKGRIEGCPTERYRSTVWPELRYRYNAGGSAMISGPYGHGN